MAEEVDQNHDQQITASEVATYVVCPEAWRLKRIHRVRKRPQERERLSRERRGAWLAELDLSARLRRYAKTAYLLLVLVVITIFLLDQSRIHKVRKPLPSGAWFEQMIGRFDRIIPLEILVVLLIIGVIIFIWDTLMRQSSQIQAAGGIGEKSELIALAGSTLLPARQYTSKKTKLVSQPHGIVREGHSIIPVDVIPASKKVRDRHVVQMLAHLRLVEEIEGKRPPYGLLIMGAEQRAVRIKNTDEKQRWLDTLLDEMYSIMDGVPAVPKPSYYRCKGCDVRGVCNFSAYREGRSPESDATDGEAPENEVMEVAEADPE